MNQIFLQLETWALQRTNHSERCFAHATPERRVHCHFVDLICSYFFPPLFLLLLPSRGSLSSLSTHLESSASMSTKFTAYGSLIQRELDKCLTVKSQGHFAPFSVPFSPMQYILQNLKKISHGVHELKLVHTVMWFCSVFVTQLKSRFISVFI